jgi:hypothetical protein
VTAERRRVRSIDLENPFLDSFEGLCEILLVRHGEQFGTTSRSEKRSMPRSRNWDAGRPKQSASG